MTAGAPARCRLVPRARRRNRGARSAFAPVLRRSGGVARFPNFELQLDVMTKPAPIRRLLSHCWQDEGWPAKGYEVQVNNSRAIPSAPPACTQSRTTLRRGQGQRSGSRCASASKGRHPHLRRRQADRRLHAAGETRATADMPAAAVLGHLRAAGARSGSEVHYRNIKVRVLP